MIYGAQRDDCHAIIISIWKNNKKIQILVSDNCLNSVWENTDIKVYAKEENTNIVSLTKDTEVIWNICMIISINASTVHHSNSHGHKNESVQQQKKIFSFSLGLYFSVYCDWNLIMVDETGM